MPAMPPSEFVASATQKGFIFSVKPGGALGVKPPPGGSLTDPMRRYISMMKSELLALLQSAEEPRKSPKKAEEPRDFPQESDTENQKTVGHFGTFRGIEPDDQQEFVREQIARGESALPKPGGDRTKEHVVNANMLPRENDSRYALQRLKRDRPDIAEKVITGELSPWEAAPYDLPDGRVWLPPDNPKHWEEGQVFHPDTQDALNSARYTPRSALAGVVWHKDKGVKVEDIARWLQLRDEQIAQLQAAQIERCDCDDAPLWTETKPGARIAADLCEFAAWWRSDAAWQSTGGNSVRDQTTGGITP